MRSFIVLLPLLVLGSVARANLGDSEAQLIARNGPELIRNDDAPGQGAVAAVRLSFKKGDFQEDVLLYHGVSAEESIYHRPYAPLTGAGVEALLKANSEGQEWAGVPPQQKVLHWLRSVRSWRRSDGTIASLEEPKDKEPRLLFHVISKAFVDAQAAAR
jgi:hypothetical protein